MHSVTCAAAEGGSSKKGLRSGEALLQVCSIVRLVCLGFALALAPISALIMTPSAANAQACATTGTNQTCTNSVTISGGTIGIRDNTSLTLTNTPTGSISGTNSGLLAGNRATVTNYGSISGNSGINGGLNAAVVLNYGTIAGVVTGVTANDAATVTNFGSISATGGTAVFSNLNAAVTNYGAISGFTGVSSNFTTNVINAGSISGINLGVMGATTTVVNSGSISGGVNGGVVGTSTAMVTNSGTISSSGEAVIGSNLTLVNSGMISGAAGGLSANAANIINTGSITGRTNNGISLASGSVTNAGLISGAQGISQFTNGGPVTIVNSGTVVGTNGTAILLKGNAGGSVTLLPSSVIVGAIDLGGAGALNIVTGAGASFVTTATGYTTLNVSGAAPYIVSGNRIASVDTSSFASASSTLVDVSRGVSSVIGERSGATGGSSGSSSSASSFAPGNDVARQAGSVFDTIPGLSSYAGDTVVFKNPTVQYGNATILWARGFVGQGIQQADGTMLRSLSQFYGGMFGTDRQVQSNLRVGAFLGAGQTRSSLDLNAGSTKSDLLFGGVFGRYDWGSTFLAMALQGGYSHSDTKRNVNNNLVPGGVETAVASYNGWYVNPEATLGHNFALGSLAREAYTLIPSLKMSYLYGSFGGYAESGSTANLSVGSRSASSIEERGQLKLTRTVTFTADERLATSLYVGVLGSQRVGSTAVSATLLGQAIPFSLPGKSATVGGFGGLGLEVTTGHVTLFGSAEYLAMTDASSVISGQGGIRLAF